MDSTDREIVRLLMADGRLTHEEISRAVHLSRPAVHDRVKRLENAGVIRGYRAEVDWEALGLPVTAFVWLRVTGACQPVGQSVLALSGEQAMVESCHRVVGEWCMLAQIRSTSSHTLQDILDRIRELPQVMTTMTVVALSPILPDSPAGEPCPVLARKAS